MGMIQFEDLREEGAVLTDLIGSFEKDERRALLKCLERQIFVVQGDRALQSLNGASVVRGEEAGAGWRGKNWAEALGRGYGRSRRGPDGWAEL